MRLALGYAGMFFGAGFVSGQEIRQFFVVYGTAGLFGLVLSALLFFAVGILFFESCWCLAITPFFPGRWIWRRTCFFSAWWSL